MMTIMELLNKAEKLFTEAGIDTSKLDAEVLLAHALGVGRADIYTMRNKTPSDDATGRFNSYVERHAEGCPVAYITGVKEFWSIPLKVTQDVLIPRPESEHVVERALEIIRNESRATLRLAPNRSGQASDERRTTSCERQATSDERRTTSCERRATSDERRTTSCERRATSDERRILDLCTGSGNIAAALATELPTAHFTLTDVSAAAIEIARLNLKFAEGRTEFFVGDLFDALRSPDLAVSRSYDLITANPPYVPTGHEKMLGKEITDYEPAISLYGGKSGLNFIAKIIEEAPEFMKPGAWIVMEMGLGMAEKLELIAGECGGYDDIVISKDLAGIERVISLRRS